jgi:3-hydroxybutyryl-CoA dehydrogenase
MPPPPDSHATIAIIGAGPLGRRLAARAASSGFHVMLEDVLPGALHHACEYIRQQLSPEALSGAGGAGVVFVSTIEDAVREADLVIDCVPDELESKLEILWLIDRMAPPRAVIATPTTELSIGDLAACTYRPEKCVAIAVSPSALAELASAASSPIPLGATPATSPETLALVTTFWRQLGFEPQVESIPDQDASHDL